jgi:hypothetical protein
MRRTIVPHNWELPDEIVNRVGSTVGRQRAMFAQDHLLLLLHAAPEPSQPEREVRLFWRNPAGQWKSNGHGAGVHVLMSHLQEYTQKVDALELALEKHRSSADLFDILRAATPLQRASRHLHATLQEAREMIGNDPVTIDARDSAVGLVRAIELLYTETKNALDFEIAVQNEEQSISAQEMATAAHRLNLLAAVFFPLVTLTGIFGMNLDSGLVETIGTELGFWIVIVIGVFIGILLYAILNRPTQRKP